jgi:CheY-like chemotaxis protein
VCGSYFACGVLLFYVQDGITAIETFMKWKADHPEKAAAAQDTLVVGLSATADGTDRTRAYEAGMHYFMQKPSNTKLMQRILDMKRQRMQLPQICAALKELAL